MSEIRLLLSPEPLILTGIKVSACFVVRQVQGPVPFAQCLLTQSEMLLKGVCDLLSVYVHSLSCG